MLWHGKNFRGFLHHALQILFDNTGTTLSSTNVEDAIKEINNKLSANYIEVISDDVKTRQQIYNQLYGLLDRSKLKGNSYYLEFSSTAEYYYHITRNQNDDVRFSRIEEKSSSLYISCANFSSSNSSLDDWNGTTHSHHTADVPTGRTFRIYY